MEVIENGPPSHWGSYDAVDHGHDNRMLEAIGQPPVAPSPTLSLPPLHTAVAPETRGNLQYVRSDLQPILRNILNMTEFVPMPGAGVKGTIQPATTMVGQPWVERAVQEGNAVLLNLASLKTPQPMFTISNNPQEIASLARSGGPCVIVAIAPGMDAAAQQAAAAPPPPAPNGPPLPQPPPPGLPPAKAAMIGGGVLALVLVGGVTWWAVTRK